MLNTSASGSLFKRSSQAASRNAVIHVDFPEPARAGHTSGLRSVRPLSTRFVIFLQYVTATFADGAWQILTSDPIYGQSPITVESQSGRFDPVNEIYWSNRLGLEIINAYYVDGHQYYDHFSYYSSADLTAKQVIKYGFQNVEKHVLVDDAYMGSDGVGFLSTSTGPMSEADISPYLDMIKASDPNVLIITDARQYLREVLTQPDYMIVAKEYTDENGLHVAELATKGTDGYAAAMG